MNLTVEDLKIIRLALSKYPLSREVFTVINNVDRELKERFNLRATYRSLPKRPYQRKKEGEYIFEQIN